MFGEKLVSDSLLAAVKGVTSGEQLDSSGSELSVGDAVRVQEGPHEGKTGTISGFQNTGRSEVQLKHGPSVALYNETLLNEEDADGTKPKWTDNHKGLYTPKQHKDRLERLRKHKESSKSTPKLRKGSKLATGWDPTESYDPELDEEDTVADFLKRGGKITKLKSRVARGSTKGKMTLKSKNPKGGGERGRRAEKKMHGEDYDLDEAGFLSGKSKHRALMKSAERREKKAAQDKILKARGEKYMADLSKTAPAGQPFSATDAAYKRRQASKAKNEEVDLKEDAVTEFVKEMRGEGRKAKVYTATGDGKSVKAQFTNKKWEDGVPVAKNLTRGGIKSVKTPQGKFKVIEADKFWYYEINKGWAAVSRQQYSTPPWKQSASTNEEYDIDEAATHKVGDTVIASKGPHVGAKHKVIHDHGNGKYNVQPVGLKPKHIKYRQGAATAHGKDLKAHSKNEEYEVDEAMSPAEIIRARKAQKRERARGPRKSGKISDKLYDYGIRKSEGKPVNVPKNTKNEGLDAVDKKSLKKKWKDREDQDIDNDGDEDESDRFLHKRRKAISKKKGEKIEINPEIKEAIRKLIHSTLK